MSLKNVRNQNGLVTSQLLIAVLVIIAIVLVLFFVLRDQGKDDKKNKPGFINPISLIV